MWEPWFTIPIHANKTVQEIREVSNDVTINKLLITNSASDALPTKLEAFDKDFTGTVMPGDFSPHQKFNLEDYDIKPETTRSPGALCRAVFLFCVF